MKLKIKKYEVQVCHNCKEEMQMTPVCIHCGKIPIAEGSFKSLEDKVKKYEEALTQMARFNPDDFLKPSSEWFIRFAKTTLGKK